MDKDAAKRFINAALMGTVPEPRTNAENSAAENAAHTGPLAHERKTQKQIDREQLAQEESSDEDEDIAVVDEVEPPSAAAPAKASSSGRPRPDPFAGEFLWPTALNLGTDKIPFSVGYEEQPKKKKRGPS